MTAAHTPASPLRFPPPLRNVLLLLLLAACWETVEAYQTAHPLQPPAPAWWLVARPVAHLVAAVLALLALANVGLPRGRLLTLGYAATAAVTTVTGLAVQLGALSEAAALRGPDAEVEGAEAYDYIAGLRSGDDPNFVVLYDRPGLHSRGGHVLFADGRVGWKDRRNITALVAATVEKAARLPGRKIRIIRAARSGGAGGTGDRQ